MRIETKINNEALKAEFALLHEAKSFRPTVVVVLFTGMRQCFVGRQGNIERNWSMVQEGIKSGETILEAAFRGLEEEVGVTSDHISQVIDLEFKARMPFPEGRPSTRGYTVGTQYYCLGMLLDPGCEHEIDDVIAGRVGPGKEVTGYRWLEYEEACRFCVLQPGVKAATDSTRQKGRTVLRPAIRTFADLLVDREVKALDW